MAQQPTSLPSDRYYTLDIIGKGAYAHVLKARDAQSGLSVAVKAIHRAPPRMRLDAELQILNKVHGNGIKPHIVKPTDQ
jgi:serine/threonine protein kinase